MKQQRSISQLRATRVQKKFPWVSLTLLLVAYASFGWFLSNPAFHQVNLQILEHLPKAAELPYVKPIFARFFLVIASLWIWLNSRMFMHPLTSFSRFVTRRFTSDTVALMSIFMVAALAAVILFWLQIFLYIFTILAVETLARIDIQTFGASELKAFWILAIVSLFGLGTGWILRETLPVILPPPFELDSISLLGSGLAWLNKGIF